MLDDASYASDEQEALEQLYPLQQETKKRYRRKHQFEQSDTDTVSDRSFGGYPQFESLLHRYRYSYSTLNLNRDRGFSSWNPRRRRPGSTSDAGSDAYDASTRSDHMPSGRSLVNNRPTVRRNASRSKQVEQVTQTTESALKAGTSIGAACAGGVGSSSAFNRIRKRRQDKADEGVREIKFRHITTLVDGIFLSCGIKQKLEGHVITPNYPTEVNLYNIPRHKHGYCACLDPNCMSQPTSLESEKSKLIMSL